MTEERWRQLIRVEPDASEVERRAKGARRRALAELRAGDAPNHRWMFAVAAIFLALIVQMPVAQMPRKAAIPTQQQTTRMELTLSDGTRVHWVFDDRFAL